jgi:hypothetical protein
VVRLPHQRRLLVRAPAVGPGRYAVGEVLVAVEFREMLVLILRILGKVQYVKRQNVEQQYVERQCVEQQCDN